MTICMDLGGELCTAVDPPACITRMASAAETVPFNTIDTICAATGGGNGVHYQSPSSLTAGDISDDTQAILDCLTDDAEPRFALQGEGISCLFMVVQPEGGNMVLMVDTIPDCNAANFEVPYVCSVPI